MITINGIKLRDLEIADLFSRVLQENDYTDNIDTLIISANDKVSIQEPKYTILASNLMLHQINEEFENTIGNNNSSLYNYIKYMIDKRYYTKKLLQEYSKTEINVIETFIDSSFNYDYDYAGINILNERYLTKDENNKLIETPELMYVVIAMMLAIPEQKNKRLEKIKAFYEATHSRKISLATPILLNLRKNSGNLSSCFITSVSDSLLSINHTINSINLISQNAGGVGLNIGRIRAEGSEIGGVPESSGGVMSWVKILDSCITAVNQKGKRKGALTVALPIWHYDFEDFLHCQTENGDLRKKAFNIFPQVIIPDLFMNKLENNEDWFMFCPYEFKKEYDREINELNKKDFEEYYIKAIENNNVRKRIIKSKELFKKIMKVQLETGLPYIMFRDTTNEVNPNKHDGIIENFNLCMESSSNFKPSKVNSKPNLSNGINIKQDITSGVAHTCNLVSPNLALIDTDEDIENIITLSVNILDNTIDITETPIPESKLHNEYYRIIGVGALGLADWLAKRKLTYKTGVKQVSELFEKIAYYGIKESIRLAKERGIYPLYEGSEWSKGIVFGKSKDWFENNKTSIDKSNWLSLLDDLQQFGIRNGGIFAIAPNTSSSLLVGATASILPPFAKIFVDKNSKGAVTIIPPYLNQNTMWYYQENKNIPQQYVIDIISEIQEWVDQGISGELFLNIEDEIIKDAKDFYDLLLYCWKKKMKTIYYIRQAKPKTDSGCVSCAN